MKKSYNKAFTLVELLAVIVILAIILVIAVPKIMDVINSSKKSTLETSVKMIASSAEKTKLQNKLLGKEDEEITCSSVAKLSSNDYENCKITFDGNTAKVTVKGKGKFEGLNVCNGTKSNATAQTGECATAAKYFSYKLLDEEKLIPYVEVKDVSKCTAYLNEKYPNTEFCPTCEEQGVQICNGTLDGYTIRDAIIEGILPSTDYEKAGLDVKLRKLIVEDVSKCTAYFNKKYPNTDDCPTCEDENVQICNGTLDGYTIRDAIIEGILLSSDFEEAGLKVVSDCLPAIITGYNIRGGLDVVIPSEIDGYTVTGISDDAFTCAGITPDVISNNKKYNVSNLLNNRTKYQFVQLVDCYLGIKSVVIPNTVTIIGDGAFYGNELTNIVIPRSVTSIGDNAFSDNPLSKVELANPNIEIGNCAFGLPKYIATHNLPNTYKCGK